MTLFDHDYQKFPELTNAQINEFGFTSPHKQYVEDFEAVVVKVHDGDTYTLQTDERDFDFPLRLLDVDTKELNEGGEQAKAWAQERLEGQKITVQMDRHNRVGKYGRLLGRVLSRGSSVGDDMLRLGLALPFGTRNEGSIPPPGKIFNVREWLDAA